MYLYKNNWRSSLVYFRLPTGTMKFILRTLNPSIRARAGCGWKTRGMYIWMTIDSTITELCRRDSHRDDWPIDNFSDILLVHLINFYYIIRLNSIVFSLIYRLLLFRHFLANLAAIIKYVRTRMLLALWLSIINTSIAQWKRPIYCLDLVEKQL